MPKWSRRITAAMRARADDVEASLERRMPAEELVNCARRISRAIARGEFTVVFQPIVDLRTRRPVGAEALVRWRHHSRDFLQPAHFIPLMERGGTIGVLGFWVLEQAVAASARWAERGGGAPFFVSVNISGRQLLEPDFARRVVDLCHAAALPTASLRLELIESSYDFSDSAAARTVDDLRRDGVQLALDDFGTGHSNLDRLQITGADILKVDRAFVSRIGDPDGSFPLIESILDLARALTLTTIAEGVENETQESWLLRNDCRYAQGYLYSPALDPRDFEQVLDDLARTAGPG